MDLVNFGEYGSWNNDPSKDVLVLIPRISAGNVKWQKGTLQMWLSYGPWVGKITLCCRQAQGNHYKWKGLYKWKRMAGEAESEKMW